MNERRLLALSTAMIVVLCALMVFFSFNVPGDWSRQKRLVLGFTSALPFALVIFYYVRSRLAKYPPRPIPRRKNANIFMFAGFVLEYIGIGFFQPGINAGLACIAVGFALLVYGSARFSRAKGYPAWLGTLLGMLSLLGFLILMLMPDRTVESVAGTGVERGDVDNH